MKFNQNVENTLIKVFQDEWDMDKYEMLGELGIWADAMGFSPPPVRKRMSPEKINKRLDRWVMKKAAENWGLVHHYMSLKTKKSNSKSSNESLDGLLEF